MGNRWREGPTWRSAEEQRSDIAVLWMALASLRIRRGDFYGAVAAEDNAKILTEDIRRERGE